MNAPAIERTSAAKAGWVVVLLIAAWLVFLLVPGTREAKPAASNALPPVAAESKLESVGLANNPDWFGLADYFAIWTGNVDWVENRTFFAYWNPGSYSYSYFFEAIREGEKIRFRSLPAKPADARFILDDDELAEYAKTRKGDSPTHPFVFAVKLPASVALPALRWSPGMDPTGEPVEKVELKPESQPIPPPAVKFPEQPNAEPKK